MPTAAARAALSEVAFPEAVVGWAATRADIRAIVMTGSRARRDGRLDRWSDYDLELFTTAPAAYEACDWAAQIAPVWVRLPLRRDDDKRYRMCLTVFEGGTKVDFAIAPVEMLREFVERRAMSELYERGYTVLLDRDGLAAQLPPPSFSAPRRASPTEAEFQATVEEFWFEASHIPKYLARNELWVVKARDWTMKTLLLRMLGWHALAVDPATDIWEIGAHMNDWLDADTSQRLTGAFGRYDIGDSWRALMATTAVFRDLTAATASVFGFAPPTAQSAIEEYLRTFENAF